MRENNCKKAFRVHPAKLTPVRLLMQSTHLYRCLSLALFFFNFSLKYSFRYITLCLRVLHKFFSYFVFLLYFKLFLFSASAQLIFLSLLSFYFHQIRSILLYIHIFTSVKMSSSLKKKKEKRKERKKIGAREDNNLSGFFFIIMDSNHCFGILIVDSNHCFRILIVDSNHRFGIFKLLKILKTPVSNIFR